MYPYLKELDLGQALQLKDLHPEVLVFAENVEPIKILYKFIQPIYEQGGKVFITALDYATHILKQKTPPEGYGYPAYELGSGRYDELPYYLIDDEKKWIEGRYSEYQKTDATCKNDWYRYAFRLTDLARVEGTDTDKTEINLGQAKWLKEKEQRFTYWLNGVIYKDGLFIEADIYNVRDGDKYEILTSTYNTLPQEFRNLASSEMETTVTDWEAKYKELQGQSRQIKEEVYELTDRLLDAQNCIAVQEREITKLKNYIINQLLNN
jgi:hypothetical protein